MAEAVGIVGVLVASDDLIDALTQQGQRLVPHDFFPTRVVEQRGSIAAQMMTLIERPQRQQTGIAGDLPAGKIALHGTIAVEGEAEL